jgi:hypothetical protein
MARHTSRRSGGASLKQVVCNRTRSGLGISPERFAQGGASGRLTQNCEPCPGPALAALMVPL